MGKSKKASDTTAARRCVGALVGASELFSVGHRTSPFMTCDSGPNGFFVTLKFKTCEDAQAFHKGMVDFFGSNTSAHAPRKENHG
jgi:hypothetical protein